MQLQSSTSRSYIFAAFRFPSGCLATLLLAVPGVAAETTSPPESSGEKLSQAEKIKVTAFRFEGNTVFTDAELAGILKPYEGREISADELEKARTALTQFYVERGYINSGATLRDQTVTDGTLTFTITEGKLTEFRIVGNHFFRRGYLKRQLAPDLSKPLNILSIRDRLQLLRQNSGINSLNADVQPGSKPGEASLIVSVKENQPDGATLDFDNHRPASVGATRLRLSLYNRNLSGLDDDLEIHTGLTHNNLKFSNPANLEDIAVSYRSPAFGPKTRLVTSYSKNDTAVIEEPFTSLNITSRSENYSVGLEQPLQHTLNKDLGLSLNVEHRHSASFLFGEPFSFSQGDVNGVSETTAVRAGVDYLKRDTGQVLASRLLVSYGNNFRGSTKNTDPPNGQFLTLLGQIQNVRVLDDKGKRLILRLDGQWANNPLLSVEKFVIGGADSVRGYRENQLVRDRGFAASAELRLPLTYDKVGHERLTLAPFFDVGGGKNRGNTPLPAGEKNYLASIGSGLLYTATDRLNAQLYYGYALTDVNTHGNLQDKGIHFALSLKL